MDMIESYTFGSAEKSGNPNLILTHRGILKEAGDA
jgi:hypothetical protein